MAAQTNFLTFTGKTEPADVHIGTEPDIKTEHFDDSPSSSEEPTVSNAAVIMDWGKIVLADGANPCVEGAESRSCGSPSHGDMVLDLSKIDESPAQPILRNFPVSVIAGKPRRFTAHWYSKYGVWLEYSAKKDAIFCKVCRHFGNNLIADKFTRGFRNWKRTHQACSKHELSKAHNTALCKYTKYKEGQQSSHVTLMNQPENHHHHPVTPGLIQNNRDHIKVMLDIVMFCVRQHIAPCRKKENDLGNFHELFQLLCKYDPRIKSRFDAIPKNKNATLTGVQNDLIDAAASLLLRQIKQELHDTKNTYYTILSDECSDQSKRQLIAVCLRYLYRGSIRERVVGFVDTGDTSAEGIALKILQILEPFELDPGLCVGFGFDGASVMSGVHGILKRTFIRALYVHCHSHSLNSVLCDASKACADFAMFSEAVNALRLFLTHGSGSDGQARFLELQKEMHPDRPPLELKRGAQAQLSSATDIFHSFDVILEILTEFAEGGGQAGLEAQSLIQQVQTKKFAFFLVASCKLFEVSIYASKVLQRETSSLSECIHSVECLKQSLADLRHRGFDQILTAFNELTEKNEIENWDVSFSRKRKLPSRDNSAVSATSLKKSTRVRCADDLRTLWYQILDSQINELDSRFHRDSYCAMKAADTLCTKDQSNLAENIHPVCTSYSVEVSDAELFAFSQMLRQTLSAGPCLSLIQLFDTCSEECFPNVHLLIRILLTLPITACTEDRICSSVNKIKTSSRSTMLTAQLNPLSLLSFEKDLTDSLDYDEIIDIFYFIKFIKPFISQGGLVESGNQALLTWKPMIPV